MIADRYPGHGLGGMRNRAKPRCGSCDAEFLPSIYQALHVTLPRGNRDTRHFWFLITEPVRHISRVMLCCSFVMVHIGVPCLISACPEQSECCDCLTRSPLKTHSLGTLQMRFLQLGMPSHRCCGLRNERTIQQPEAIIIKKLPDDFLV